MVSKSPFIFGPVFETFPFVVTSGLQLELLLITSITEAVKNTFLRFLNFFHPLHMSKWKSLAFEVLLNIVQLVEICDLPNFALVCKAWSRPAQTVLYSDVDLYSLAQLNCFYHSVMSNPQLGWYVERFVYYLYEAECSKEICELMSNLLNFGLPNLQQLFTNSLKTCVPALNALQNPRFKTLKVLHTTNETEEEEMNHASCLLLMNERVKALSVYLANNQTSHPVYNILDKLDALSDLDINSSSQISWFSILEYVAKLKALHRFKLQFINPVDVLDFDVDAITPSTRIESLTIEIWNSELFWYTIHKFPQLREFAPTFMYSLGRQELIQLLVYLSCIDIIDCNFLMTISANFLLSEAIVDFWDMASSTLGSKTVHLEYSARDFEKCGLYIQKSKGETEPTFEITNYDSRKFDTRHVEIVDKMGKYIGEFHFSHDSVKNHLPQQLIEYLFTDCPNIHTLHFNNCLFRKRDLPQLKFSITELGLHDCIIFDTFFNDLSFVLRHINRLIIEDVLHGNNDVGMQSEYEQKCRMDRVDMPHTTIDSIGFHLDKYLEKHVHIKLFVTSENMFYYYLYNGCLCSTNEIKYEGEELLDRIYICCVNKPKIQFKRYNN